MRFRQRLLRKIGKGKLRADSVVARSASFIIDVSVHHAEVGALDAGGSVLIVAQSAAMGVVGGGIVPSSLNVTVTDDFKMRGSVTVSGDFFVAGDPSLCKLFRDAQILCYLFHHRIVVALRGQ